MDHIYSREPMNFKLYIWILYEKKIIVILTQMLGHLQHQPWGAVLHLQGVEDGWQLSIELYIHHGTNDCHNPAIGHASLGGSLSLGSILAVWKVVFNYFMFTVHLTWAARNLLQLARISHHRGLPRKTFFFIMVSIIVNHSTELMKFQGLLYSHSMAPFLCLTIYSTCLVLLIKFHQHIRYGAWQKDTLQTGDSLPI